jgi:hypothetical protein
MIVFIFLLNIAVTGVFAAEPAEQSMELPQRVGRDAAAKYFEKKQGLKQEAIESERAGSLNHAILNPAHYLSIDFSRYAASQSYQWGRWGGLEDVAGNGLDVTYRAGQWHEYMDLSLRIGYNEFNLGDSNATKLSFMPLITFPESNAHFPLYFGIGAGLGVFLTQVSGKSPLSLDYQLVVGSRFLDIFQKTGFFLEAGLKNHLLLTSSGQMNGTFLAGGLVFTF